MQIDLDRLFSSDEGKRVYSSFLNAISDFSMDEKIRGGVIVGFSGGADSVTLLSALVKYSRDNHLNPPVAVHVNHMIRGDEADRDQAFAEDFAKALGVEFLCFHRDIPSEAKALSKGLEEVARNARYSIFNDLIKGRNDISCIAVAHNATDNLETVIFNMMRGAGSRGLAGIKPERDNIIRPLIYLAKRDIVSALQISGVPFAIDSTNSEIEYSRNYIRSEILPKLYRLCDDPEAQSSKSSRALRADDDFISSLANEFFHKFSNANVPATDLASIHEALFFRVVSLMAKEGGCTGIEHTHILAIRRLLLMQNNNFSVSLPGEVSFVCERGLCRIDNLSKLKTVKFEYNLSLGENYISEIDAFLILSHTPIEYSSKVYKIAIQESVDSDIIVGGLTVREKRDGDSYVFGGMTRKLKKLFCDRAFSSSEKAKIPVICDESGILFVPGFRVRDGGKKNPERKLFIALAYKSINN